MTTPLERIWGGLNQIEQAPPSSLASVWQGVNTPSTMDVPSLRELLKRRDLSFEQRVRINKMIADEEERAARGDENVFIEAGKSFAQGVADPFVGAARTIGKIPGLQSVARAGEGLLAALEPSDVGEQHPWVQTGARVVGGLVGYMLPWKVASSVVGRLGQVAAARAPGLAGRMASRINLASEAAGKISPTLGQAVRAAPQELATGLGLQALTAPQLFGSGEGLAWTAATSLGGLLVSGLARAKAQEARLRAIAKEAADAKDAAALLKLQREADEIRAAADAAAEAADKIPGLKVVERRGTKPSTSGLPTQLEAANRRVAAWQEESLAAIQRRLADLHPAPPETIQIAADAFGILKPGEQWDLVPVKTLIERIKDLDDIPENVIEDMIEAAGYERALVGIVAQGEQVMPLTLDMYTNAVWRTVKETNIFNALEKRAILELGEGIYPDRALVKRFNKYVERVKKVWWKKLALKELGFDEPPPVGLVEAAGKFEKTTQAAVTRVTQKEVDKVTLQGRGREVGPPLGIGWRAGATPVKSGEPSPPSVAVDLMPGRAPSQLGVGGTVQGLGGATPIIEAGSAVGGSKLNWEVPNRVGFGPRPGQEVNVQPIKDVVVEGRSAAMGNYKDLLTQAEAISRKKPKDPAARQAVEDIRRNLKFLKQVVGERAEPQVLQSALVQLRAAMDVVERPLVSTPAMGGAAARLERQSMVELRASAVEAPAGSSRPPTPQADVVDWHTDPSMVDPDAVRGFAHRPLPGSRVTTSYVDYRPEIADHPEYVKEVLSHVKRPAPRAPIIPRTWADAAAKIRMLKQHTVHAGAPLQAIDEALLQGSPSAARPTQVQQSILATYELARGSTSTMDYSLKHGIVVPNPDGTLQMLPNTPALQPLLREVAANGPGSVDRFVATMLSRRVLDGNYKNPTFSITTAQANWANRPAWYDEAFEKFTQLQQGFRAFGNEMLGPGTTRIMDIVEPNYVNLTKAFEAPEVVAAGRTRSARAPKNIFDPLRGGSGDVVDPLFSTIDRGERLIRSWYYNRAAQTFADVVDDALAVNPESVTKLGIVKKVAVDPETHKDLFQAAKNLKANIQSELGIAVDFGDALEFTMQMRGVRSKAPANTISVWREGKIQQYYVPTDIAQAYNALRPVELHWLFKLMGYPATALKMGITQNPAFQVMNFVRDSWDATLNSRYGFTFGVDSMRGLVEAFKKGPAYREWLAHGGAFGTLSASDIRTTARAVRSVIPGEAAKGMKARLLHAVDAYREFTAHFEEAARLGEYMKAKGAGATALEAAYASRKVTVDFSQMGLSMAGLSHMTAFLNPGVQSLYTMSKAVQHNPAGVAVRGLMAITLPSFYLWWANKDDPEIQELRRTEAGMTSWFARLPNGAIARIPKPFLYGQVFGSTIEATLDAWNEKDPEAVGRWRQALVEQIGFQMLPSAVQTVGSLWANKDVFTGMPIVPQDVTDVAARFQTQLHTARFTELFTRMPGVQQALGAVGLDSPARFEYVLRQLGGTIALDAWRGIDLAVVRQLDPNAPATPIGADIPVVGRLVARYPTLGTQSVREFYAAASRVGEVMNTVNYLERERPQELKEYIDANLMPLGLAGMYADARREIAEVRNSIAIIQNAPIRVLNPERKRELVDSLVQSIIDLTREINDAVKSQPEAAKAVYPGKLESLTGIKP